MTGHFDFLKKPFARKISLILLVKFALLMGIRSLWFDAPVEAMDDGVKAGQHLLGPTLVPPEKIPK